MSASFCDCVNQWEQVVGLQVLRDTKYLSVQIRGVIFLSIKIRNKDETLFFPFKIGCRKFTGTLKFRIENKQMLNFNADGLKVSKWRKLHNVIPPLHCLVIRNWEPNVFHSFHPSEGNFRRGCCLCLHYC